MKNKSNNFAYTDGANLYRGIESLNWKLDYSRFRVWLSEKYGAQKVYLFIGLIELTRKEKAPGEDGIPQGSFS